MRVGQCKSAPQYNFLSENSSMPTQGWEINTL